MSDDAWLFERDSVQIAVRDAARMRQIECELAKLRAAAAALCAAIDRAGQCTCAGSGARGWGNKHSYDCSIYHIAEIDEEHAALRDALGMPALDGGAT